MDSEGLQKRDVRMKRHPELQPFIPSDRDRICRPLPAPSSKSTMHSNNNGNNKSKKIVSMTRLDQLAQPKRVHPQPGTLTASGNRKTHTNDKGPPNSLSSSSNTTATSSLASNKNYNQPPLQPPSSAPAPAPALHKSPNPMMMMMADTTIPSASDAKNSSRVTQSEDEEFKSFLQDNSDLNDDSNDKTEIIQEEELKNESDVENKTRAEDEARIRQDEELKERARLAEEERQSRQLLVDSILSKFSQSP